MGLIKKGIYLLNFLTLVTLVVWFMTQKKQYQYDWFYALIVSYAVLLITGWFNGKYTFVLINSLLILTCFVWFWLHDDQRDWMYLGLGVYAMLGLTKLVSKVPGL